MKEQKDNTKKQKIVPFPNKKPLNIGLIIFGIIFVYLIATVVMYITAPHITVYEVRQGSILKDNSYTGLAIRDEIVVNATADGYINYIVQDTSKVKVNSYIYTLSADKLSFKSDSSADQSVLSTEEQRDAVNQIQKFVLDFNENNFRDTYDLKDYLTNSVSDYNTQSKLDQLTALISEGSGSNIQLYKTEEDGVVVCSVDGLENLTIETANISHLNRDKYKNSTHANNTKIKSGDALYKIVTNDEWTVMIETDQETAIILQEKNDIKVNFTKDNEVVWASINSKVEDGHYITFLSFDSAMVRYAKERYLDIELILEDKTGLKIPKSAKTEKEFYVIPNTYITQGGNNSKTGVLMQSKNSDGDTITEFVNVVVYYETDGLVYLDPNEFNKNTILLKPESDETLKLKGKKKLKGVYCINKGYAMFKQINILCESDSYYIVEEGNSYGLSNYDHIALDSSGIKENDVVF